MAGPVILIVAMLIVGPVGLFLVAAVWSGIMGWMMSDDSDLQSESQPSTS